MAGMKFMPPYSSATPNVKRALLWTALSPTVDMSSPIVSASSPLSLGPLETTTAQLNPNK